MGSGEECFDDQLVVSGSCIPDNFSVVTPLVGLPKSREIRAFRKSIFQMAHLFRVMDILMTKQEDKLLEQKEEYEMQKLTVNLINSLQDEVIDLDVGGQRFTTTRSTLVHGNKGSGEDCMFKAWLSGRWAVGEVVFVDREPDHFASILNYLRSGDVATSRTREQHAKQLVNEARYYGVDVMTNQLEAMLSTKLIGFDIGGVGTHMHFDELGQTIRSTERMGWSLSNTAVKAGTKFEMQLRLQTNVQDLWVGFLCGCNLPKCRSTNPECSPEVCTTHTSRVRFSLGTGFVHVFPGGSHMSVTPVGGTKSWIQAGTVFNMEVSRPTKGKQQGQFKFSVNQHDAVTGLFTMPSEVNLHPYIVWLNENESILLEHAFKSELR
eukprot:TRINITY_DN44_c0_g1_i1.p1 TRINITY_DN44_c0_g1~~TRINITY_DN44_c0_g1_i1.p1  ORF type:complete len:378 (-),score=27.43 TRINITY_DN44_c0_g1_i1:121-1254(-)